MPLKRPVVLLLEDDPDEAELMRLAFQKVDPDCDLRVAMDGQEALALAVEGGVGAEAQNRGALHLVILDLKLPGMTGDEVLRALKSESRTQAIPVLVLTSSDLPEDVGRVYADGANALLRKPLAFSDLANLVAGMMAFWFSPCLLRAE